MIFIITNKYGLFKEYILIDAKDSIPEEIVLCMREQGVKWVIVRDGEGYVNMNHTKQVVTLDAEVELKMNCKEAQSLTERLVNMHSDKITLEEIKQALVVLANFYEDNKENKWLNKRS